MTLVQLKKSLFCRQAVSILPFESRKWQNSLNKAFVIDAL